MSHCAVIIGLMSFKDSVEGPAAASAQITAELERIASVMTRRTTQIPDLTAPAANIVDDKDPELPFLHKVMHTGL